MAGAPSHRSEQTGNPALDRIQNNVRDLVQKVRSWLQREEAARGRGELAVIDMRNADVTLTQEQWACGYWMFQGTLTAQRTVRVPQATRTATWSRWVSNDTGGGFALQFVNPDGFVSVAGGDRGHLVVTHVYGPEVWP